MADSCTQPGCTGSIVDGYCDVCGSPAGAPASTPAPVAADSAVSTATRPSTASVRLASTPFGSARTMGGSRTTRRLGSTSTRARSRRLGAGLTTVPPVAVLDPKTAIMAVPEVPENRRVCPACGAPVGRSRAGRPGRPEGFCPKCRAPFSFTPKLVPGDLVAGQYEVAGCLAHGGLGWVYLARDHNVSDRWVVLKGLLNAGDPDAYAAAIAERQFLAEVEHPLIVEIYNFVMHGGAGYIVMEYVGGTSLKELLKERMAANSGVYDPVPVDQAIAYLLEVMPAFQYLHDLGLLYCDFKPDNIIQVGDAVKLIDLGGVRRTDDQDSAIYGTVGYQAPEVPEVGPSVASDVYTVGRTLVALASQFRGNQTTYVASLPPVVDTPLFQRYDSLYRLLVKACAPDPADRFASADEMRAQLLGVLREIVAADRPRARVHSTSSVLFDAPSVAGDTLGWRELPDLLVDDADPMASWLSVLSVTEPQARLQALAAVDAPSVEVRLELARTAIEAGRFDVLDRTVAAILADDPWEWRAVWMQGLADLDRDNPAAAQASFNAVYGQVPGELAPKLALALACENGGEAGVAESLYQVCARTDANYTAPAAFGLARIRSGRKDLDGALVALDLVPATSRAFVDARLRRARLLAASGRGLNDLAAAMASISAVAIPARQRAQLSVEVLTGALAVIQKSGGRDGVLIDGVPATEGPVRDGLERAYRDLAGLTGAGFERVRLVDEANQVRRWTLR